MLTLKGISAQVRVVATGELGKLAPDLEVELDGLWERANSDRSKPLFNGKIFSVTSLNEALIKGLFIDYRLYVAQTLRPELFAQLAVRPLGVSALTVSPDGVVIGQRNLTTTQNPGLWELAPSGGVDPENCNADGEIDIKAHILGELYEELGLGTDEVDDPLPFCLLDDSQSHVLDIGVLLHTRLSKAAILESHRNLASDEYLQVEVVAPAEVDSFLARPDVELAPESRLLLQDRGLLD